MCFRAVPKRCFNGRRLSGPHILEDSFSLFFTFATLEATFVLPELFPSSVRVSTRLRRANVELVRPRGIAAVGPFPREVRSKSIFFAFLWEEDSDSC